MFNLIYYFKIMYHVVIYLKDNAFNSLIYKFIAFYRSFRWIGNAHINNNQIFKFI